MFSSVTSWLGGVKPDDDSQTVEKSAANPDEKKPDQDGENSESAPTTQPTVSESEPGSDKENDGTTAPTPNDSSLENIQNQVDEVSAKAINAAKEWGSYLYSFGKTATDQAVKAAKQLKDQVEEKTIIGDFNKEQEKFAEQKRDIKKQSEAAIPPWVGYNEEEAMKTQILALSQDKRNFVRNPPAGVQFQFDFVTSSPVAMAMLDEDPNLKKMRFELVPKQLKEETFWRNYFYRVSLIKQSAQLTSLAQNTGNGEGGVGKQTEASKENEATKKEDHSSTPKRDSSPEVKIPSRTTKTEEEEIPPASPPDHEFISDTFQDNDINDEDLKKEMQNLGLNEEKDADDIPEWEKELQAELQEYEVVTDGQEMDDADLEQEILQQIEAEAKQTS